MLKPFSSNVVNLKISLCIYPPYSFLMPAPSSSAQGDRVRGNQAVSEADLLRDASHCAVEYGATPEITVEAVPHVPGAFVLHNILTPSECKQHREVRSYDVCGWCATCILHFFFFGHKCGTLLVYKRSLLQCCGGWVSANSLHPPTHCYQSEPTTYSLSRLFFSFPSHSLPRSAFSFFLNQIADQLGWEAAPLRSLRTLNSTMFNTNQVSAWTFRA